MSKKDDTEVEQCRKAAQASVNAWSYARKKIIDIIDQAKVLLIFFKSNSKFIASRIQQIQDASLVP